MLSFDMQSLTQQCWEPLMTVITLEPEIWVVQGDVLLQFQVGSHQLVAIITSQFQLRYLHILLVIVVAVNLQELSVFKFGTAKFAAYHFIPMHVLQMSL